VLLNRDGGLFSIYIYQPLKKTPWPQSASELYRPSDRRLSVKLVPTFFCILRVPRGQRDESLRPYSWLSRPEPLLFLPSSTSVALTRLSGPRSRPTTFSHSITHPISIAHPMLLTVSTVSQSKSESLYGCQSVSMSWCRAYFVDVWPDIASFSRDWVWDLLSCLCGAPSLTRGRVCPL
jgi:hypothetical protein